MTAYGEIQTTPFGKWDSLITDDMIISKSIVFTEIYAAMVYFTWLKPAQLMLDGAVLFNGSTGRLEMCYLQVTARERQFMGMVEAQSAL
ncbi:uncharacterized protein N7503_004251 [Penicillium pulvis]|uniref:uncharacterized protein n=1 Tax=Penicillium pulvis TaxID=1562058 RepID=UPI0025479B7B|nr:uncharacterized protein N7503_004251 [Penicillium pulvis]KAJ5806649.1 hypothetical protein N7503_004251 [Penicillium pulvis]